MRFGFAIEEIVNCEPGPLCIDRRPTCTVNVCFDVAFVVPAILLSSEELPRLAMVNPADAMVIMLWYEGGEVKCQGNKLR